MGLEAIIHLRQELFVTSILFILLFGKIGSNWKNETVLVLTNVLLALNFLTGLISTGSATLFAGMFETNELIQFQKSVLNLGILIISLFSWLWLKKHRHLPEFYMLLLSAVLGMFFMISSGNFLIFYLSLELATIPLAALCNFDLERRTSSEAAMKMIMSSAFSSGLLLFGISLMYGATGTLSFTELPSQLEVSPLIIFSFILLFTGFAFKISAVPFHLWTADVYEGSPVAVTAFLSVVSKGAIVFIFITALYRVLSPLAGVGYAVLFVTSLATMIIGNLFAMRQQNMKRFLAFSSIAQVGFILIGISAFSAEGQSSAVYFILVYVFSNLGAFGVVSVISETTGKEKIDEYKGLYRSNPFLTWVLTLSLFSLAGIPPTAGFFGKLFLLTAGASSGHYIMITAAALNMVVSLYYYLRVVRSMFMEENETPLPRIQSGAPAAAALVLCCTGIILVGIIGSIYNYVHSLSML